LVDPIPVDKSNIDKTLVATGIYKKDEIFNRLNWTYFNTTWPISIFYFFIKTIG